MHLIQTGILLCHNVKPFILHVISQNVSTVQMLIEKDV